MQDADHEGLTPELRARLHRELDAIAPPRAFPRYLAPGRTFALRLAPAALAAGLIALLAISAYAETGSTNPAVWSARAVNVIRPAAPPPASEEGGNQTHSQDQNPAKTAPAPPAEAPGSPEPSGERTEPDSSGEPDGSGGRSDDQSDSGSADH